MIGVGIAVLVVLAIPVLMVATLVDMLRRPAGEWDEAGQNQLLWVLLVVFLTVIGVVLYVAVARPRLEDAASITRMA